MNNIAIIPARSGSKGLPDKNIKVLNGHPLLFYSIKIARNTGIFSEVMVSTDSEKYAEIAIKNGASVPFLRSDYNSSDNSSSWNVVSEVLKNYLYKGQKFDTVCLLQPTSPLRTVDDITNAYNLFKEKNADAITSVCECDHSPLWCMTLNQEGYLGDFRKGLSDLPRQKIEQYYRFNGAIYIRKIEYQDSEIKILDKQEFAYVMKRNRSIDIDTQEDFEYAEYIMKIIK